MLNLVFFSLTGCTNNSINQHALPYNRDLHSTVKVYKVKPGDTLYSIGYRSGLGYKKLAKWNSINPPYQIKIGQKIRLYKPALSKQSWLREKASKKPVRKTSSRPNKKSLKLRWQWPMKGKIIKKFSQSGNKGIDIVASVGKKVRSAAAGKVVYSGNGLKGYGNLLIIKHDHVYLSAYANNRRLLVKEGQKVKRGQLIAEVGKVSGKMTSLHFEIRKNGNPVNPLNYLPKL